MIVNPAYIYMTEKIEPTNPVIWENGTVNYPYTNYGSDFNGTRFNIRQMGHVDFTLPLKGYKKITFKVSGSLTVSVGVADAPGTNKTYTLSTTTDKIDIVYDIPPAYRKNDVVIRLENPTSQYIVYAWSGKME